MRALTLSAFLLVGTGSDTAAPEAGPARFVAGAFPDAHPAPALLWLTPAIQDGAKRILGAPLPVLRQRYWRAGARTAWILERVGKEEPITAGFVIEGGRIVSAQVLVYRESRGGEIRFPNFRDQFTGAGLDRALNLDTDIDGIAGATLSVDAMRRMARLALYLHKAAIGEEHGEDAQ